MPNQTKAPFSKVVPIKPNNQKMVRRNDTYADSAYPTTGTPQFASMSTRYISANQLFGIEQISVDYQTAPAYPDFLGSVVNNQDFFKSQQPTAVNLPSFNNPNRFK